MDNRDIDQKEELFDKLRKKNLRITKQRKEIIDILEGKHLTVQEIYSELQKRGFKNLATVYNSIDFLIENKIVAVIFINGKKHFDLTIDKSKHNADTHVHVACKNCDRIIEINEHRIVDKIKNDLIFENFNIDSVQVVIGGNCQRSKDAKNGSENDDNIKCFLEDIEKH